MRNVDESILQRYYELWCEGAENESIQQALKLSKKKFQSYAPYFLAYCRKKIKHETRDSLTNTGKPIPVALTPNRKKEFLELVGSGLDYDKAAKCMGVPLITVLDYWFQDEYFKTLCEMARDFLDAKAIRALYRKVVGYDYRYTEKSIKSTKIKYKDNDQDQVIELPGEEITVTKKVKHFSPDVKAIEMWLTNSPNENWKTSNIASVVNKRDNGNGEKQTITIGGQVIEF